MLEPLPSHLPYIDHIVTEGEGRCEKTGTRLTYERPQLRDTGSPSLPGLHTANRACARALREELGALKVICKGTQLMCHVLLSSSCLPSPLVHFQPQEEPFLFLSFHKLPLFQLLSSYPCPMLCSEIQGARDLSNYSQDSKPCPNQWISSYLNI